MGHAAEVSNKQTKKKKPYLEETKTIKIGKGLFLRTVFLMTIVI